jgi:hypothetical protein
MWRWHQRGTIFHLVVVLFIAVLLTIIGCQSDDDNSDEFEGAENADLQNRTFVFADGRAFSLPGQSVTLEIGVFGQPDDRTAPYTLTTDTSTVTGDLQTDPEGDVVDDDDLLPDLTPEAECDFRIVTSTIPELAVGGTIRTTCEVSDSTGALRVTNEVTNEISTSDAPEE